MKTKTKHKGSGKRTSTPRRIGLRSAYLFAACVGLWMPKSYSEVLVDLNATALPEGELGTWENQGTVAGDFVAPAEGLPSVTTVDGIKGVTFNGSSDYYTGPVAPTEVTGFGARTIEAWIYNPELANEETIFSWGRRGEPPGGNMSFNHGTNPTFGAVGHWGAPDLGWDGNIAGGRWTYVVYTYDGFSSGVTYFDGAEASRDDALSLDTWSVDNPGGNPLPFRVAAQNEENGAANTGLLGSLTIAKLRVHNEALDAATIQANFEADAVSFGLEDPDGDLLPTWYENRYAFLDPNSGADAAGDGDGDGLTNLQEFELGTAPDNTDTDGDGVEDAAEVNRAGGATDPLSVDTDGDTLSDLAESGTGIFVDETDTGTDPLLVDTDADTYTDDQEIRLGSDPNSAASIPQENRPPVVALNATELTAGPLEVWPNEGSLAGEFVAPEDGIPEVEILRGVTGVRFNGTSQYYTGPATPSFLTGNASRTIEAWIWNPAAAGEETIFSWGRRGGGEGSNTSFNHGLNADFGAVGMWGAPDIGWTPAGDTTPNVIQGQWTYVAFTYDGETMTTTVYSDGQQANTEVLGGPLVTHALDTNNEPLPFRVAAQNEANGTATAGLRGSMTIAEIRVYDRALDAAAIADSYEGGLDKFGMVDYDTDQLPTWYERIYTFLDENTAADAAADEDSDGLTNLQEFQAGSLPDVADTDGDGLSDGDEVNRPLGATNPLLADTDQDGLSDAVETGTGTFVDENDTGTDPVNYDTDFDLAADQQELIRGTDPHDWASYPDFATPVALVNLDAAELPAGPVAELPNLGALGGTFVAAADGGTVETVAGVKGITFDGLDDSYIGPIAPVYLTGNKSRTVEGWIYNPEINTEETVFSWGRRGGPDGTLSAFFHGTSPQFGALGLWGEGPDVGWGGATNLVAGEWTHVAYTYNETNYTATVYSNGALANSEPFILPLDTHELDTLNQPLPFRFGGQSNADGSTGGQLPTMTIARLRVYDQALTAEEIAAGYQAELEFFSNPPQELAIESIANAEGMVTITWTVQGGAAYTVEATPALTNPNWTPVATGETDGSFSEAIAAGAGAKFYRITQE